MWCFLGGLHDTTGTRTDEYAVPSYSGREFAVALSELNQLVRRKAQRLGRDMAVLDVQRTRPWRTVQGIVEKILKPVYPDRPEKVQILITAADELFREIRIENTLTDPNGQRVALKNYAKVDLTFEADANDTLKLIDSPPVFHNL